MCRVFQVEPSILLHPLDFLGADDVPELAFFPAMNVPSKVKLELAEEVLSQYARWFRVVPMGEHVEDVMRDNLPVYDPDTGALVH